MPPQAQRFAAVLLDGRSVAADAVMASSTDSTQVFATFPPGTGALAVAVAVQAGAVTDQAGAIPNADDEIGVTNLPASTLAPGVTAGPMLSSAVLSAFGGDEAALLTFDQPLAGPAAPNLSGIHAYDPDGTELTCTPPASGGGLNGLDSSDNPFPSASAPATLRCDSWALGDTQAGPTSSSAQQASIVLVALDPGVVANVAGQLNPAESMASTGGVGIPAQS
jgi:hypothetical protein